MILYEFNLGDGWFGNIEYSVKNNHYTGLMYVTSEYSEHVYWYCQLDSFFGSKDAMIEYCTRIIRTHNT